MIAAETYVSDGPYSKAESWKMFNRISRRYDFLNRFLSFGLDVFWRKSIARYLPQTPDLKILDLATGTGDVLIYLLKKAQNIKSAVGIDMAQEMLKIGKAKIEKFGLADKARLEEGDINQIPFGENQFDAITIAFGIRNVEEPSRVLTGMFRTLKKGGRALILEFSLPQNAFIRAVYLVYLRHIMPVLGALISGDFKAYSYLNKTVEAFPNSDVFCRLMRDAGFSNVKANPATFGVGTIYQGDK